MSHIISKQIHRRHLKALAQCLLKRRGMQWCNDIYNMIRLCASMHRHPMRSLPISAQIEPTSRCNLRCRMCVRPDAHTGHDMSYADFCRIIDRIPSLLHIKLQGNGEPLLHEQFCDMIAYAHNRGIFTATCTNATILTQDYCRRIIEAGLNELGISLESVRPDRHEYLRTGSRFATFAQHVAQISHVRDALKSDMTIVLYITVMPHTEQELEEIIDFAKGHRIDALYFQKLQEHDTFSDMYAERFGQERHSMDQTALASLRQRIESLRAHTHLAMRFDEACSWPFTRIYITSDAEATPCCVLSDTAQYRLGNVLTDDLKEVWNHPYYKALRTDRRIVMCKGCNWSICRQKK